MTDQVRFYEASDFHKKDGWTLSFAMLRDIQKEIEDDSDNAPSLEQIEQTLLAFRNVNRKVSDSE